LRGIETGAKPKGKKKRISRKISGIEEILEAE